MLSLAILLSGIPTYGFSGERSCCAPSSSGMMVAKSEGKPSSTPAPGCCASSAQAESQDGCCCSKSHPVKDESNIAGCCQKSTETEAPSSPESNDQHFGQSNCGGDQCPCAAQRCCGQVHVSVLFFTTLNRTVEMVSVSHLSVVDTALSSRSDRPLVPPPKVRLAI